MAAERGRAARRVGPASARLQERVSQTRRTPRRPSTMLASSARLDRGAAGGHEDGGVGRGSLRAPPPPPTEAAIEDDDEEDAIRELLPRKPRTGARVASFNSCKLKGRRSECTTNPAFTAMLAQSFDVIVLQSPPAATPMRSSRASPRSLRSTRRALTCSSTPCPRRPAPRPCV